MNYNWNWKIFWDAHPEGAGIRIEQADAAPALRRLLVDEGGYRSKNAVERRAGRDHLENEILRREQLIRCWRSHAGSPIHWNE